MLLLSQLAFAALGVWAWSTDWQRGAFHLFCLFFKLLRYSFLSHRPGFPRVRRFCELLAFDLFLRPSLTLVGWRVRTLSRTRCGLLAQPLDLFALAFSRSHRLARLQPVPLIGGTRGEWRLHLGLHLKLGWRLLATVAVVSAVKTGRREGV